MRHVAAAALLIVAVAAPAAAQQTRESREAARHLRLGQENLRAEKWDKAEIEFKAAIKLDPLLELAHYGLGQSYMGMKRFDAAVAAYTACRTAFHTQAGHDAASRLQSEARVQEQIQQLQDQKAQLQQKNFTGGQSLQSGAVARVESMLSDLRQRRFQNADAGPPPTPTWISVALGSAYFRSGATADAEREYREALKVDPKLGEAHSNLAVVCLVTGRVAEADAEITAAEKSGFAVNPQLKADVKKALAGR
jgi:tetratricopeptide (TPR) repeat protein